jgi:hypothetical protein
LTRVTTICGREKIGRREREEKRREERKMGKKRTDNSEKG